LIVFLTHILLITIQALYSLHYADSFLKAVMRVVTSQ